MQKIIAIFLLFLSIFTLTATGKADTYAEVQKAEYERNLRTCLGGYPALCDHALLSQEHAEQAKRAEYGKSSNFGKYEASPPAHNYTPPVNVVNQPYTTSYPPPTYNPPQTPPTYNAPCAENGSCYGDLSSITGLPKTVSVHGYYRRDGTYVRGHYRSHR